MISSDVIQKLKRVVELKAIVDRRSPYTDFGYEAEYEEYFGLRGEITGELEDLMQELALSKFFTVSIPITPELTEHITAGHYKSIELECESVFDYEGQLHFEVNPWDGHCGMPTPEWSDAEDIRREAEAVAEEERKVARHERERQHQLAEMAREEAEKVRKAESAQWNEERKERAQRRLKEMEAERESDDEDDDAEESGLDPARN